MAEVAGALAFLHSVHVVHADLTGNNILLSPSDLDGRGFTAQVGALRRRDALAFLLGHAAPAALPPPPPPSVASAPGSCRPTARQRLPPPPSPLAFQVADFGLSRPTSSPLSTVPRPTFGTGTRCWR